MMSVLKVFYFVQILCNVFEIVLCASNLSFSYTSGFDLLIISGEYNLIFYYSIIYSVLSGFIPHSNI